VRLECRVGGFGYATANQLVIPATGVGCAQVLRVLTTHNAELSSAHLIKLNKGQHVSLISLMAKHSADDLDPGLQSIIKMQVKK